VQKRADGALQFHPSSTGDGCPSAILNTRALMQIKENKKDRFCAGIVTYF